MKHLKKYNESISTKSQLKELFYDLSDNGFIIDIDEFFGTLWGWQHPTTYYVVRIRNYRRPLSYCPQFKDIKETLLFAESYAEKELKLEINNIKSYYSVQNYSSIKLVPDTDFIGGFPGINSGVEIRFTELHYKISSKKERLTESVNTIPNENFGDRTMKYLRKYNEVISNFFPGASEDIKNQLQELFYDLTDDGYKIDIAYTDEKLEWVRLIMNYQINIVKGEGFNVKISKLTEPKKEVFWTDIKEIVLFAESYAKEELGLEINYIHGSIIPKNTSGVRQRYFRNIETTPDSLMVDNPIIIGFRRIEK